MKREVSLCLFIASLLTIAAQQSSAQDVDDVQQGIKAYGTYSGSDIDLVSMTNGNLTLRIPLISYPQRGKLQLSYSLFFNNKQKYSSHTTTNVNGTATRTVILPFIDGPVLDQTFGLDSPLGVTYTDYSVVSADGAEHQLAGLSATDFETVDGTGLHYYQPTSGTQYFVDGNGTRYFEPSSGLSQEDTNGNQIKIVSGGGLLDSVGRTIPPLPSANGTGIAGTCPSGPLPVSVNFQWVVPGPNGGSSTYVFCWAKVNILKAFTYFSYQDPTYEYVDTNYLQSVVLPNGTAWTFQYSSDKKGDLVQVTYPAGATISYLWEDGTACAGMPFNPRYLKTRTIDAKDGNGGQPWSYSYLNGNTTVQDPLGNNTVYTNSTLAYCSLYTTAIQYYKGAVQPSNLLKTVSTQFMKTVGPYPSQYMNIVPTQITTTWAANGTTSQVTKGYDSGFTFPNPKGSGSYSAIYGKVTSLLESDYGTSSGKPGPLLRQTNTNYAWQSPNPNNASYLKNNMLNLVYFSQVTDGVSQKAYTQYGHDETSTIASGMTAGQNLDLSVWTGTLLHGNQTSVNRWRDLPSVKTLKSKTTFYDTGMSSVTTDPLLNTTTYSYSGTYQAAYVTQVKNALNQSIYFTYDYNTGLKATTTDLNGQITTDAYDSDWRLLSDTRPTGGGTTSFCYTDLDPIGSVCPSGTGPYEVVITKAITSSINEVATAAVDGLGRLAHTQLNSDPDGVDYVDQGYDGVGNKATNSNPYRATSDTTYGTITNAYDALHRVAQTTQADGSVLKTVYCANTTLVTDETGKWRRSTVDGLGRLVEVDEPNSATATVNSNGCPNTGDPVWATIYTYNQRGDLISVTQAGSRQRTFTYDSLSRLQSASNPESGTLTYTYDDDGNVLTKVAPSPNQLPAGGKTATTTYTYDSLNRLTGKGYSDVYNAAIPTAPANYAYDGNPLSGCTTAPPTLTDTYPIGHRTSMCDGSGATSWKHDTMGRVLQERRTIGTVSGDYENDAYNLDGSIASSTSLGYSVAYTYGKAARPLTATHSTTKFVSGATYAPSGELAGMTLGSATGFAGITVANTYNNRLQPILLSAASPSGTVFSECFDFHLGVAINSSPCVFPASSAGDNGNVYQIENNRDSTRTQNFMYDWLNRIQQAYSSGTQWGETFGPTATAPGVAPTTAGIDTWGNLLNRSGVTGKANFEPLSASSSTNNQLSGFGYDPAGNMISNGSATYVYDDENRLIAAGGNSYIYDGDGRRVEKCTQGTNAGSCATGATGTLYWRGLSSDPLSETNLAGVLQNTYIFFNGQRVASSDSTGAVHYYFSDHLGSHGVVENATGSACEQDVDYYPYGGLQNDYCGTQVAQNYKFTGKERDSESGNDYFGARYFGSSMGRFLSPDPLGGDMTNPQFLNRYSYVLNNPLTNTDPTGMYTCVDSKDCSSKKDRALEKTLASLRNSNDADVARAADAYGAQNKDNGVSVDFKDLSGSGKGGDTVSTIGVDADGNLRANSAITLNTKDSGTDFAADVGHEGSHAADAQDVVKSGLTEDGQAIHAGMNITPYQSEQRAYGVTNSILNSANESRSYVCGSGGCLLGKGASDLQGTVDRLVGSNPIYNQGGRPMSSTNQGASVVSGVTPKATVPSVPH